MRRDVDRTEEGGRIDTWKSAFGIVIPKGRCYRRYATGCAFLVTYLVKLPTSRLLGQNGFRIARHSSWNRTCAHIAVAGVLHDGLLWNVSLY